MIKKTQKKEETPGSDQFLGSYFGWGQAIIISPPAKNTDNWAPATFHGVDQEKTQKKEETPHSDQFLGSHFGGNFFWFGIFWFAF